MKVSRSGFYKWKARLSKPTTKELSRLSNIDLFVQYHNTFPSHGYRWLNAKIKLDLGVIFSDNYAHKCCKYAAIKSEAKHYRYKGTKERDRSFPNLLLAGLAPAKPFQVVVSDMTAFWANEVYYELTLYMDLFNNEIISYGLTSKRGDNQTYFNGLTDLIQRKKEYGNIELVLHTDHGSVYSSKDYNHLLLLNNITHSMSKVGTPTDNGAMESINGWIKEELFCDFKIKSNSDIPSFIENYIHYFNYERPSYSLDYLTPIQYKEKYTKCLQIVD